MRLGGPAVVRQRTEARVGAWLIAHLAELAGVGAFQVAAERRHGAHAVAARWAVRDDRVREEYGPVANEIAAAVVDAAARRRGIAGHRAAPDRQPRRDEQPSAELVGAVAGDRGVLDAGLTVAVGEETAPALGDVPRERAARHIERCVADMVDAAANRRFVATDG